MTDVTPECGECGQPLDEIPFDPNRQPCPFCGSTRRILNASASDVIEIKEQMRMQSIDPALTGKAKLRLDQIEGDDLHRNSGQWNKKIRVIDKNNDRYLETITDPKTGEVIHHCEEPLSEHFGHGSAKKLPDSEHHE
jgi:hypothetical protein